MQNYRQPFITIGIASYNYAKYLTEAFEAIKRQKFKDFEILYADDGSTDESVSVIESFITENPNMTIRLIAGENIGLFGNKQRLIDNAHGKYLMLCDADDWMDDDCLEILAEAAFRTNADRVVSEIRNVDGDKGKIMYVQSFPKNPSKWCEALHHGALYKLSVIRDNQIKMPKSFPDDFLFITRFNLYAKSTHFVRKSLYNWRLHSISESHRNWENNQWRGVSLLRTIEHTIRKLDVQYRNNLTKQDFEDLKLFMFKNYCYYCIKDISSINSFDRAFKEYDGMRNIIRTHFPECMHSLFSRGIKFSPFRPKIHFVVALSCLLEKVHLFFPMLRIYGILMRVGHRHSL